MANAATLTSTFVADFSTDVMLAPVFANDELFKIYNVDPTVNKKKTFLQAAELKRVLQKKTGCGFSASGTFALSEKSITTQPLAIELEQCADQFWTSQLKAKLKRGTDVMNVEGTDIADWLLERAQQAIINDIFELGWFGDEDASTTFFQSFEGWFELFEDNLAAANLIDISGTGDLSADEGLDILRNMYCANVNPIKSVAPREKFMLVTDSIYCNLLDSYENLGNEGGLGRLLDGGDLTFRGIPVINQPTWDTTISDQSWLLNPHRAVYTTSENLMIGTDIMDPTSTKVFYDELNEKFYIKGQFDMGVQYLFDEWTVYAR